MSFGVDSKDILSNTYSLQDALSFITVDSLINSDNVTPYLFSTGCTYNGVQNCTAACQDPALAFVSLDTLHNCKMYPTIAEQYLAGNLSSDTEKLASSLGIEPSKWPSALSSNIANTIKTCLVEYCSTIDGCNQTLHEYANYHSDNTSYVTINDFTDATSNFYFDYDVNNYEMASDYSALCEYTPASVNQDIGGIGVYISYWIQTGISLLAFLTLIWWKWAVGVVGFGTFTLLSGPRKAMRRARKLSAWGKSNRLPALTSALVEFHKAQCFFMLAINLAAQVNRTKGGLQPQSLQQLYNTWVLIKSISISGYLHVTFTLFTLHLVDMVSWYILLLSACTVAVSVATLVPLGSFNPSAADMNYLSTPANHLGVPQCGGITPGVWCYMPVSYSDGYGSSFGVDPSYGAHITLYFCVSVLFLLIAYQFRVHGYLSRFLHQQKLHKMLPPIQHIKRCVSTMRQTLIAVLPSIPTVKQRLLERRRMKHLRRSLSYHIPSVKLRLQKLLSWRGFSWTQSQGFMNFKSRTTRNIRVQKLLAKEAISYILGEMKIIDWFKACQLVFVFLFYFTIVFFYIYFFNMFCSDLSWFAGNGVGNSWSFGQIVAITVWAEPICEYIHLEIRGMKRGSQHRLLAPYKVVREESKEEEISTEKDEAIDDSKRQTESQTSLLPIANSIPLQTYLSGPTKGVYSEVRDLGSAAPCTPSESDDSAHGAYDQSESHEDFTPLELDLPEQERDITWQMSDFQGPERVPLAYD